MKYIQLLILTLACLPTVAQECECATLENQNSVFFKDGRRYTGVCKSYLPSDKLIEEAHFQNGVLDGEYWNYNGFGNVLLGKVEGQYKAGKAVGKWTEYLNLSETGEIQAASTKIYHKHFKEGVLDGAYRMEMNGKTYESGRYVAGIEVGGWEIRDPASGDGKTMHFNQKGQLHGKYLELVNGQKMLEGDYVAGKKEALWRRYLNGKLHKTHSYRNDQIDGEYARYFPDGKTVAEHGFYVTLGGKALQDGKWEFFYENGTLKKEESFAQGVKSGAFKEYLENGNMLFHKTYLSNKLHGSWKQYFPSGPLRIERKYDAGKLLWEKTYYKETGELMIYMEHKVGGIYKRYHENGKPKFEFTIDEITDRNRAIIHNGPKKFYSKEGILLKTEWYENGEKVKTER